MLCENSEKRKETEVNSSARIPVALYALFDPNPGPGFRHLVGTVPFGTNGIPPRSLAPWVQNFKDLNPDASDDSVVPCLSMHQARELTGKRITEIPIPITSGRNPIGGEIVFAYFLHLNQGSEVLLICAGVAHQLGMKIEAASPPQRVH